MYCVLFVGEGGKVRFKETSSLFKEALLFVPGIEALKQRVERNSLPSEQVAMSRMGVRNVHQSTIVKGILLYIHCTLWEANCQG